MFHHDHYCSQVFKNIPNITLNQYNTLPSPPLTTSSYTPMTPVYFGSAVSDRDTPVSGTVTTNMDPCSEYNWLSANGSTSLTNLLDMPNTTHQVSESSSSSSLDPNMELLSYPDIYPFKTDAMDLTNGSATLPTQGSLLKDTAPSFVPMLSSILLDCHEPLISINKKKVSRKKVAWEPLGPETSIKQHILQIGSNEELMKVLRENALGASVKKSIVPIPIPLEAPVPSEIERAESPLAPIQLPQLPLVRPMSVDLVASTSVPVIPRKKSSSSKKKKSKPRLSANGKPIGRPLGSFKVRPATNMATVVPTMTTVAPKIVAPIPIRPVIVAPIVMAPPAPKIYTTPKPKPKIIVACPKIQDPSLDDGELYVCLWDSCGKQFTNSDMYYDHVNDHITHYGNKLRICYWEGCSRNQKPFDAYHKVQVHIRVHTKETPFRCDHPGCEKVYKRLENLRTHQLSHTNVKLYKCRNCKKKFVDEEDCITHEKRAHLGKEQRMKNKRFACLSEDCDKRYMDPSALRKHLNICHPELIPAYDAREYRWNF